MSFVRVFLMFAAAGLLALATKVTADDAFFLVFFGVVTLGFALYREDR